MAASRRRLAAALWTLAVLLSASAPRAASDEERIREAIDTYTRGLNTEHRDPRIEEFRRAQRLFASVAIGTRNAALYTNLGNAALQAEDLGNSILAYRRALRVAPGHPRALQNLDHARSLLPAWVPRPGPEGVLDSFFFWHRTLSSSERQITAALCFALAMLLIAASIRFESSTPRNVAILPALVWVALLASLVLDRSAQASGDAVVTVETAARAADSSFAPNLFPAPLPEGAEVRVLEDRSPWKRVRLANRRDVWVKESSLTPVRPEDSAS